MPGLWAGQPLDEPSGVPAADESLAAWDPASLADPSAAPGSVPVEFEPQAVSDANHPATNISFILM
jgi:hypothetical protein